VVTEPAAATTLVDRALAGDRAALASIYADLAGDVARYLRSLRLGLDHQELEDAVQEAFLRLFRSLRGFERGRALRPFVLGIARNVAIDRLRRRRPAADVAVERLPGGAPAADGAARAERSDLIGAALAAIEPELRTALALRHTAGLSMRELGEALGCSQPTARARLREAAHLLAVELRRRGVVPAEAGRPVDLFYPGPRTVKEVAEDLVARTGVDLHLAGGHDREVVLQLRGVPLGRALETLAARGDLWLESTPGGGYVLRPAEENHLVAHGVGIRTWLQLLAALAEVDLVAADGLEGVVATKLSDVSYRDALDATLRASGCEFERGPELYRVRPGPPPPERAVTVDPRGVVELEDGTVYRLEAAAVTPERALAVISGRIYRVGDELFDDRGDLVDGWRVAAIERGRVEVEGPEGRRELWPVEVR